MCADCHEMSADWVFFFGGYWGFAYFSICFSIFSACGSIFFFVLFFEERERERSFFFEFRFLEFGFWSSRFQS